MRPFLRGDLEVVPAEQEDEAGGSPSITFPEGHTEEGRRRCRSWESRRRRPERRSSCPVPRAGCATCRHLKNVDETMSPSCTFLPLTVLPMTSATARSVPDRRRFSPFLPPQLRVGFGRRRVPGRRRDHHLHRSRFPSNAWSCSALSTTLPSTTGGTLVGSILSIFFERDSLLAKVGDGPTVEAPEILGVLFGGRLFDGLPVPGYRRSA